MTLDNDLLTKWTNAILMDEHEVRDLIEEVQAGRDDLAAQEAGAEDAVNERADAVVEALNAAKGSIEKAQAAMRGEEIE